jgi:[acyl-carrier-protein] S-malonyltransferase
MTLVFMFPGQSSRYAGMLDKLVALDARNAELLEEASGLLGRDLGTHYREDNPDAFACNRDVQIGVFLANHMFLRTLERAGVRAELSLGLSLGEYNHLVHIGALDFRDALLLVEQRGLAYDAGPRGSMAVVQPLALDALVDIAARASAKGVVEVVNLNSPRQNVLSGDAAALEEALRLVEEETMAHAVVIDRQVPMHSSLFEPVRRAFRQALETRPFASPQHLYLPNRLGRFFGHPRREDFVELLAAHVCSPVLWRQSVDFILQRCPDAAFVEVGPRSVLFNLLHPSWHRVPRYHADTPEGTAAHLAKLIEELRARMMPALPHDARGLVAGNGAGV